jgi:hypothetical protein
MPSAEAVIAALTRPETWPDYASEIGRFTPLRAGGLPGQTFEIEVAVGTGSGRPMFTRGYVTITALVTPDDPAALEAWFAALEEGMARYGENEPRVAWVRAAGTWDPMPWHIGAAYRTAGSDAQHAFWGQGDLERLSMLHQLAQRIAA